MLFKLKALIIENKSELDGDIWITFHVPYFIRIWADIRKIHINFAILSDHVTVIYLIFNKSIKFYVVKQKKLKQLHYSLFSILVYKMCFSSSNKNVSKIKWLVRKSYLSKSVKRILGWLIFLLYKVRSECQYILSNLAAGYTTSTLLGLNLVSAIFYLIFIFHQMIALQKPRNVFHFI